MTEGEYKADAIEDDDKGTPPLPKQWLPAYPTFDQKTLRHLFDRLDEPWDDEHSSSLRQYHRARRFWIAMEALFTFAVIVFAFVALTAIFLAAAGGFTSSAAVWTIGTLLIASSLVLVYLAFWWPISGARPRYFRSSGITGRALFWKAGPHKARRIEVSLAYRNLGLTARALFATLHRSRWTWASPPAASARVLRLTRPLLDIELKDEFGLPSSASLGERHALGHLVLDVAGVVALHREDLIPRVRDLYHDHLHQRVVTEEDEERDALFLDPMRTRTRWEVIKDFAVPMTALAVSILSLSVALTR